MTPLILRRMSLEDRPAVQDRAVSSRALHAKHGEQASACLDGRDIGLMRRRASPLLFGS
jgi:hypothetical protein